MDLATSFIWRRNVTQTISTQSENIARNPYIINFNRAQKNIFGNTVITNWLMPAELAEIRHAETSN